MPSPASEPIRNVDKFVTGEHAARLGSLMVDGGRGLSIGFARLPLLSLTLQSATGSGAMTRALQAARRLTAPAPTVAGLHAAAVVIGFRWLTSSTPGCPHGSGIDAQLTVQPGNRTPWV